LIENCLFDKTLRHLFIKQYSFCYRWLCQHFTMDTSYHLRVPWPLP